MSADTDCVGDFKKQLANMIEKEQLTLIKYTTVMRLVFAGKLYQVRHWCREERKLHPGTKDAKKGLQY